MTTLQERILEISREHKLSHIGSCLTSVGLIDQIYKTKKPEDLFVLSCGHAALALYVVLEAQGEALVEENLPQGIHPDRLKGKGISCSTGSLGQGITVALGMALADRNRDVYCLISDGESMEGTIWEVSNIIDKYEVTNLHIWVNFNGYGAYDPVADDHAFKLMHILPKAKIFFTKQEAPYTGLAAHYMTI